LLKYGIKRYCFSQEGLWGCQASAGKQTKKQALIQTVLLLNKHVDITLDYPPFFRYNYSKRKRSQLWSYMDSRLRGNDKKDAGMAQRGTATTKKRASGAMNRVPTGFIGSCV
jgi:hypothetical protein